MHRQPEVSPRDVHNQRLLSYVHPADWTNPTPAARYNLVVIGAGSGGLITAAVAAGLGARVALVEKHLMGGDCLNYGCVPSKALIRSAHDAATRGQPSADDFARAMERMRGIRAEIGEEDAAARYAKELGVDVFLGEAQFVARDAVEVDGARLRFRKAVIATGARPLVPEIPGLADAEPLTNETVFSLVERPRRLAVIGGGPIGCELAQAFRRLGSAVTLLNDTGHVLNREDADAAAIVQEALRRDGVQLVLGCEIREIEKSHEGRRVSFRCADGSDELTVDRILVAAGRAPNVEGLGLDVAGVAYDERRGVHVDDRLRTSNRRIFAVGDCCMRWKFTHAADAAAKIVVQNALFFGRKRLSQLTMPWVTYTDPEIAHVGIYEHEAREQGLELDTFQIDMARVNRAVCDGQTDGFVKVHVRKGTDKILGATIVGARAGDMISELTLAIVGKLGLSTIAGVIHPYPTQAEGIKAAANAYMRTRLTPLVKALFKRLLAWVR